MPFNSYQFMIVFLPATLALFFAIGGRSQPAARLFLLAASFLFYAWWSTEYALLILATIVVNYWFAQKIQGLSKRQVTSAKLLLSVVIAANVCVLGYCKYRNFFVGNFNAATGTEWPLAPFVLPLAISFSTLQQIAYLVESYRHRVEQPSLATYSLFVLFFPQLVAGPIVRHHDLLPQLHDKRIFSFDQRSFAVGLSFFVLGLAKKLLIADPLSTVADPLFDGALVDAPTLSQAWTGLLAFTFAFYFDFSGYCDMAIGVARMIGLRLPYNFDSPYRATSIIDFWRRWNITLATWLHDYLYVPLTGGRRGKIRRSVSLLCATLLGGLWYGPAWHFALWGLLLGACLIVNHAWRAVQRRIRRRIPLIGVPAPVGWLLTFSTVIFAWVLFRSPTMAHAYAMLEGLAGLNGLHSEKLAMVIGPGKGSTLAVAVMIALLMPSTQRIIDAATARRSRTSSGLPLKWQPTLLWSIALAAIFFLSLTRLSMVGEFVHFPF